MVMIQTKMAMWWTWARIAVRELGSASRARSDGVPAWKFEAAEAASLSAEFERSVTTIAACAFSMEALCKELEEAGHTLVLHFVNAPTYCQAAVRRAAANWEVTLASNLARSWRVNFQLNGVAIDS